ncbi:zinc finger protein ZAT4 [Forsythia ovata]|uniref:Zinc finger protein ZAT4 n=1 Tax=Forsythia ovata TaxID=205694 RepID=A0ABD1U898_9LAMI
MDLCSMPLFIGDTTWSDGGTRKIGGSTAATQVEEKIHECPICFSVFTSGQGLGGYKRSRFIGGRAISANVNSINTPAKQFLRIGETLNIDLNLPAPVDNDEISQIVNSREIPFYGFVQQPPMPLRPFSPVVDNIHSEISGFNMPLGPHGVAQPVPHGYEAPIMAVPISCITPEGFRIAISNNHESVKNDGRRGLDNTLIHQLSYSERKENWYIRSLQRNNEIRSDLASDASSKILGDQPKRIRGDKLIDRVKVGIYNLTKGKVHRTGTPPTASNSEEPNNSCLGTENKKRKRIEENSVQQFREANSSEAEDELVYTQSGIIKETEHEDAETEREDAGMSLLQQCAS